MANLKLSTTLRNNMLDEITSLAGANAVIKIFSGTQPAGGGAETTVLVTLTCSATLAPAASAGVLTLSSVTGGTAVASGTASWYRLETSGGTFIMDGDVSDSGGNGDLTLNDRAIVLNGTVNLTGPNLITAPNAA
jgi:hypothetical protein